jgi:DNA repair protein RadC
VDSPGALLRAENLKHEEVVMQTLRLLREGRVCESDPKMFSPQAVYKYCRDMIELDREHFVVLHLDGKNRIVAKETVSIGSLNKVPRAA